MVRVAIVDDNEIVRLGLTTLLQTADGIQIVGTARDGEEAIALTVRARPDVVLLDLRMPGMDGLTATPRLTEMARVLILTYAEERSQILGALAAGAIGYLVHGQFSHDDLIQAITNIHQGCSVLSPSAISAVASHLRGAPTDPILKAQPAVTATEAPVMVASLDRRLRAAAPTAGPAYEFTPPSPAAELLSTRERQVMALVARGQSNHAIAAQLYLSEKTVKNHINRIFAKLAVSNRAAAIAIWLGTAEQAADL